MNILFVTADSSFVSTQVFGRFPEAVDYAEQRIVENLKESAHRRFVRVFIGNELEQHEYNIVRRRTRLMLEEVRARRIG